MDWSNCEWTIEIFTNQGEKRYRVVETIKSVQHESFIRSIMIERSLNVNEEFLDSAQDVINILYPILKFGGLWPLDPPGFRYLFFLVPYIITKLFGFIDLINVFGNLELTIENIAEETLVIVTVSRIFWVRFSPLLPSLINTVSDGMRAENFDSDEERQLYLEYNVTTKMVVKFVIAMGMAGTIAYHVRPLIFRMIASFQGETNISYVLPYRAHLFFDYQHLGFYSLVYLLQSITIFIHFFVTATIGLLFMLCFHCCGELSALQHKIKTIDFDEQLMTHNLPRPDHVFKDFLQRHMKIIEIAKNIDKASQVVLLEELATMTIILALSSYCAMLNVTNAEVFLSFSMWCTSTLSIIYAYCYIGEALMTESFNVQQAYYASRWYDFSQEYKRSLAICMIGSSRPLILSGGGFYTYSKFSFTAILKSAAAYLSMLRNLAEP
ncbi:odorant receptor 13a [Fopius arisanus]|uniref:Odorant receptor n=1 Tax=Fopius arisanus TaxID=64838 RepID=A0A0C9PMR5_9HYME|nr:PREDICTED: odorant receptor 13a-like [Fopius arisanus]XP_011309816.1 PREDICTED: odorant receptor 13a-like [Fopius arisanus]